MDGRVRSTNAGRVDVLDMVMEDREIFADECEVLRRFAEGTAAGSVWPLLELAKVGFGRDGFEEAALCCCSKSLRFEGVLDKLAILSTEESLEGFIDVVQSLDGHECVCKSLKGS